MDNCTTCDAEAFCHNISRRTPVSAEENALIMSDPRFNSCIDFKIPHRGISLEMCIPYAVIFLLSVVGNSLVVLTLFQHKKMRTITNVYLLNLAISDLLLAVFCMPFTLIPLLLQDFVFGAVMCALIRYLQAVSVGVSCFTLVAISLERFYAICQPLRSRRWQTLSHSYKVICGIWIVAFTLMVPIACYNKVTPLVSGSLACREIWDNALAEKLYTGLLDVVLLLMPLIIMATSYGRVAHELRKDLNAQGPPTPVSGKPEVESLEPVRYVVKDPHSTTSSGPSPIVLRRTEPRGPGEITHPLLLQTNFRQANYHKILMNKKRVMKMLCVVVLEYFICWTPLFLVNTWTVMDYLSARRSVSLTVKSTIFLLAYLSSCIHPITYCFMNKRFRQGFVAVFSCCGSKDVVRLLSETSNGKHNSKRLAHVTDTTSLKFSWRRQV
ncbi:cholecystokinin receptor type A-like [Haliotis rubra]|uniref:cholecystokinin receptor type A-like n=1 Tax=Haliotis rubra TaxID=36100 RepID=UPI001EE59E3F|nr:cholecystokinin receptor type A-like [Haliotis rubra]